MHLRTLSRQPYAVLALLAAMLLVAGCGSQIDDIATPDVRATAVTPGGIYNGNLTSQVAGSTPVPVVALVDNQDPDLFVIYAADGSFLASGAFSAVGSGLTGQARYFDLTGASTATTTTAQTLSISGTYVPQSEIGGQYSRQGAATDTGVLNLTYQVSAYEQPSAIATLAGVWANVDVFGTPETSFSFDPSSGGVSGLVMATGCRYNGNVEVIDLRYNIYSISLAETCGAAPVNLTGLATLLPASAASGTAEQLVLALGSTATEGQLFRLSRSN